MSRKEILIFDSIQEIADSVVSTWKGLAEQAMKEDRLFSVALSGGRTPEPIYKRLAEKKDFPWYRTHVFMVDERYVPYEDERNNYRMINQSLLIGLEIPATNIHPILTTELYPEDAARDYENDLITFFKDKFKKAPGFDLILLGIGEDGHIASLFPESEALKEQNKYVVVTSAPDRDEQRITITLPVINNSSNIMIIVTGKKKARVVRDAIEGKGQKSPASLINPQNGKVIYLLDTEAASLLKK